MRILNLTEVVGLQLCCGCGVCSYLSPEQIEMIDVPAFGRRPKIKKQDLDSSRVLQQAFKVCPGAGLSCSLDTLNHSRLIKSLIQDWGPIFEIWEGYAANRDIRFQS